MSKTVGKFNAGIRAKAEELRKKAALPETPRPPIRPNGPQDTLNKAVSVSLDDTQISDAPAKDVQAIKASLCEPSSIKDRMDVAVDAELEDLIQSIRDDGQKVPILVRPHLDKPGHYEIAYGRRRWKACLELGIAVLAIIDRNLNNEQLVIAQGKENHERKNLSYIETAVFVEKVSKNYPSKVVMAAIGVNARSVLATYSKVTRNIPPGLIDLIGPAPKIGRPKWEALANTFEKGLQSGAGFMKMMNAFAVSEDWLKADSNQRFKKVFELATKQSKAAEPEGAKEAFLSIDGKLLVEVSTRKNGFKFGFVGKEGDELSAFLKARMHSLIKEFESERHP
ncbi:Chromosome-partitioning protein ParB [Pseudovibrio sp. Ad5]|uniref:plasmid partitioning protein RepB n=1 Tax=Pseudovibrio sp. Ad5 TaxID=989436 RepID=UPI0007AE5033|nr:plasmid partitioning protein RepB [Pseudovibrio sp. Ad5]KZK96706.1 Chromosome-partitioning protein ParB [Pseudovibrio sp. Ad5]